MIALQGWIPRTERTGHAARMTRLGDLNTPEFRDVNRGINYQGKTFLLYDLEKKATGGLLPRIWQKIGSCVGAAAARAYAQAICGDICMRGTREQVKLIFPWATWGYGRMIGRLGGPGEGSFGYAQAEAVSEKGFGMLASDDARVAAGLTVANGWAYWTAAIERAWSWPKKWPIAETELRLEANEHQVKYIARIRDWDSLVQAFAQGYPVTCASMFGCDRPKVMKGVLIARQDTEWAHQMSWSGVHEHPELGPIVPDDNQWGPDAHPECPWLSSMGVRGSFSLEQKTVEKLLADDNVEVFAHGSTEDWPERKLDFEPHWGIGA